MVGAFVGPVYDRGHLRALLLSGSFMIVFGHMMLSLCKEYWQVLLAQGFVVGIGGGCLYVPSIAILPTYFTSRIGLAIGLAASGSSMGGVFHLHSSRHRELTILKVSYTPSCSTA